MNLLLDTHTLMWSYFRAPQLSTVAARSILDPANVVFVSAATSWEIAIKMSTGKLSIAETFEEFVQHAIHDNRFPILPIEPRYAAALIKLPFHHRDPFDRIIIAQAIVDDLTILSADAIFDLYPIRRVW